MIRVDLTRNAAGQPLALRITGHADQGDYGEDIVCAAVSALVETLALGLTQILKEPYQGRVDAGDANFSFRSPMPSDSQAVVETIVAGLKDLSASEPQAVRYQEILMND